MSDVERAKALLQAAGLSGVAVGEAPETVEIPRAELDALKAAAGGNAAPGAPVAGDPAPAGVPPQVQQLGAELVEGTPPGTPPTGLPQGIMSVEQLEEAERNPPKGLSHAERMRLLERTTDSYTYHLKAGNV